MTTSFYLRDTTPTSSPTSGEKSTTLPVGTFNDGAPAEGSLAATKGSSRTNKTATTPASATHQDSYVARFSSDAIQAGTRGSGTWTFRICFRVSSSVTTATFAPVLYFWRPSTNAVVGFIIDADTGLSTAWQQATTDGRFRSGTFSGSNVVMLDGDILVLEVWGHGTQSMGTACDRVAQYNGATDWVDDATTVTDPASILIAPADLPLYTAPAVRQMQPIVGGSSGAVQRASSW